MDIESNYSLGDAYRFFDDIGNHYWYLSAGFSLAALLISYFAVNYELHKRPYIELPLMTVIIVTVLGLLLGLVLAGEFDSQWSQVVAEACGDRVCPPSFAPLPWLGAIVIVELITVWIAAAIGACIAHWSYKKHRN